MRNIFRPRQRLFSSVELILAIIIFIALLIWLNISFNSVRISNSSEQLNETNATINKAVVLCYSIEGSYPPSIDYLKKNYGLTIDENRFAVEYNVFASNMLPSIVVLKK